MTGENQAESRSPLAFTQCCIVAARSMFLRNSLFEKTLRLDHVGVTAVEFSNLGSGLLYYVGQLSVNLLADAVGISLDLILRVSGVKIPLRTFPDGFLYIGDFSRAE